MQLRGHPEELIFWVVVNCHLKRSEGLGGGEVKRGLGGVRRTETSRSTVLKLMLEAGFSFFNAENFGKIICIFQTFTDFNFNSLNLD